jgi:hypothetical protein
MPNPNEDNPIQKLWEYIPPYTTPNYPPQVEVITTTNTGDTPMTDTTPKFDPIHRLQEIATIIKESGADIFYAPTTVAYDIECAIKEIERLRRDYSCICNEMRRMMEERDEARRMLCEEWAKQDGLPLDWQGRRGPEGMAEFVKWDCYKENKENTND